MFDSLLRQNFVGFCFQFGDFSEAEEGVNYLKKAFVATLGYSFLVGFDQVHMRPIGGNVSGDDG